MITMVDNVKLTLTTKQYKELLRVLEEHITDQIDFKEIERLMKLREAIKNYDEMNISYEKLSEDEKKAFDELRKI